jgi:predicted alpha-1,2-mannosidase
MPAKVDPGRQSGTRTRAMVAALLLCGTLSGCAAPGRSADDVDPFIGTAAGPQPYAKGNTFPGAVVPNGMVANSPDTNPRYSGGYRSGAEHIEGFSQNHMSGVGCAGDLGNILLMPTVGAVTTTEASYRSTYSAEAASPGYYRVFLATPHVTAELSATTRATISRLSFPARAKGDANIVVDVSHGLTASRGGLVRIVSDSEVEGYNDAGGFCRAETPYRVHFVARFSKAAVAQGTWSGGAVDPQPSRTGSDIGAYFRFKTAADEAIEVRLGLSYVSIANARANLDAEIPDRRSFAEVRAAALARWNADLGKVVVKGGTAEQRTMLYTALYHSLIHPSVNSDVNGQYQGMGGVGVRTASGYTHHHLFSLWDTYRSLHPLLSLLYPRRQEEMVRSMIAMYQESGWLPKWEVVSREWRGMVGDPATIVIADTYLKGITGFDVGAAYAGMRKSALATESNPLRPCIGPYVALGYVPQDACPRRGSVSITQEYAYADHAVALLAQRLGHAADHALFAARSRSHRNLFDGSTGFFRPRNRDGTWMTPFDPLCCALGNGKHEGPGYTEGTAWQYRFMVPHDIAGLKALLGGDAAFVAGLNAAFTDAGGYYTLINQPDMAYPYLYTYVPGQAWRTQAQVRRDIATNFATTRAGLPGNDDAGQTSSRLFFDMVGFYPADPLSGTYQIGSPVFASTTLHLDRSYHPGAAFVIQAENSSAVDLYIRAATLNGRSLDTPHLAHAAVTAGGVLALTMDSLPSGWGH